MANEWHFIPIFAAESNSVTFLYAEVEIQQIDFVQTRIFFGCTNAHGGNMIFSLKRRGP